jgi:hypothetical protein
MKKAFLTLSAIMIISGISVAQTENSGDKNSANHQVTINFTPMAILDIEGDTKGGIHFTPVAPTEAGNPFDFSATDNTLWLNFTSMVEKNNTRNVNVKYSGDLPAGVSLKVSTTGNATGKGQGNRGSSTYNETPYTLTTSDHALITGIKTAYTGDGINNGYQLTYSMEMDDAKYLDLESGSYNVQVVYTITDK